MEPILTSDTDRADDSDRTSELLVLAWRAEQLRRLGLSRILAESVRRSRRLASRSPS